MTELKNLSAVALKYPLDAQAPLIAAKERGRLAKRMIEIAEENEIPVIEDDILENVLSIQDVGQCIPEETWEAVASIFAYIIKVEQQNAFNKN
ncbi:MAG: EscU/YscU/HrcU family type III secretion system export apparatus switch protein [Treponema sp.]|nr:EscU/YscU/HrcU family type III secretion system export apparatus switch protein [Treponema sp.]MBR7080229.1 EscU/YscU/HrcU family type III secretion system export apparatus switch protein [Treponema sp.]